MLGIMYAVETRNCFVLGKLDKMDKLLDTGNTFVRTSRVREALKAEKG